MKFWLFRITLILCTLSSLKTFSQVDLSKGLVAYYPFNGNANDASGNGNNPIFNNATLTSDVYGNANSAYHFNGEDNYIQIPNSSTLNFSNNRMSLCAWVRPTEFYTGICYNNILISKEAVDYVPGNYSLRFADAITGCSSDANTQHEVFYGPDGGIGNQDAIELNKWYNVVFTSDGIRAKLYVNCQLVVDEPVAQSNYTNPYDLFLGHLNDGTYPYWLNGDLDEVRIYNRALDEDEVHDYSVVCNAQQPCSNWLKVSQNVSGFQIGDLDIPGDQITVEATFNRTAPYSGSQLYAGDLVSKHEGPSTVNYLLRPNSAEVTTTRGYFKTPDICDIELNKTYHVAMVYDGKILKFYRNGYLMSSIPCSGNLYQNNFLTAVGTLAANPNTTNENLVGYVNEVRIWNVARSQDDIKKYMDQSLPNPADQIGLLAYYTFDDLRNKQGNSRWDGKLLGDAQINQTNPTCGSFVADSCSIQPSKVVASFTGSDTACISTSVQFKNTSVGASNYYWSFCTAGFNTTPVADNLGNPGNFLSTPVFMDYALDDNGNYYGFVSNYDNGHVVRLDYGSSLLNTPKATDLGNFNGLIPIYAEGIQVKKANGKCYVFVVAGGDANGFGSVLVRLDFGSSFSNVPTATSLGNVGGLLFPHDLFIAAENGNYYGFTINIIDNTITRFDFGNDLENQPVGVNLGSIGNTSYPCGFSFINTNGNWYAFIANRTDNSISRLDFGNSLTNIPSGINIGNPGGFLNKPRDISIFQSCSGVVELVVNEDDETTGTITKLDFGDDVLSNPQANDLGNLGDLQFPHSISKFFLEGNDIYSFITNVENNTITRLRYKGCTSTSIASSTLQTPPPVTYSSPGVYNVNLLVDIGLPTQTSFCKQIVVKDCSNPCDTFKIHAGNDVSICYGDSIQLNVAGGTIYNWDKTASLSDTTIANPFAHPLKAESFIVTGHNDVGCSAADTVKITVLPLPAINLTNDTAVCIGGSVPLNVNARGNNTYNWLPSTGLSASNISDPMASPQSGTKYFVTVTGANNCAITDSVFVDVLPLPAVSTINDASICMNDSITLTTNISNASILQWTPSIGLSNATMQNPKASPSTSTLYTMVASNGICSEKDSVLISVLSLPDVQTNNDTTVCGNASVQLNALGAVSYTWLPSVDLSDATISNPVASPNTTTTYVVKGVDVNSCANTDSVKISVNPTPQFSVTPQNTSLCLGDSVVLIANGGDVYSWSPAQYLSTSSLPTITAVPLQDINYLVTITNTVCKTTQVLTAGITVKELPIVTVTKSNDIDCLNFESQLNASGGINYSWSPSTYISNANISNPVVNPPADTKYVVTALGSNGCKNQDSVLVVSNKANAEAVKFEVANAFTPNDDGLNDCFSVKYWGPADVFDMAIYNRWGQVVFHSNNINNCWDGRYKGIPQPMGTYVYVITVSAKCSNGVLYKKGTLVLMR